jgi:hypothetical protein
MRLLQMVRYVMMKVLFRQGHVSRGDVCWERSRSRRGVDTVCSLRASLQLQRIMASLIPSVAILQFMNVSVDCCLFC